MALLIFSFIAGILTVAAPCVLPVLPIIIGGSIAHGDEKSREARHRPYWITLGLVLSVVVFTLLLKATTSLLGVPQEVWQVISGGIIIIFGLSFLFPALWERVVSRLGIEQASQQGLKSAAKGGGKGSAFLLGAALGPVFNSCSPTYALIVAVILPATPATGVAYLLAYALGLGLTLLLVAFLGRSIVQKLGWLANPNGWVRKLIGALFLLVGLAVIFGLDKQAQEYVLEKGWYDPIANIEHRLNQ